MKNYKTNSIINTENGCVNAFEDIVNFLDEHDLKYEIGPKYPFGKYEWSYLGDDPYCGGTERVVEDDVYAQDITIFGIDDDYVNRIEYYFKVTLNPC